MPSTSPDAFSTAPQGSTPGAAAAQFPSAQPIHPRLGHLQVQVDKPGIVYIDDHQVGTVYSAPLLVQGIPAGCRCVAVRYHAGGSSVKRVRVVEGQTLAVMVEPTPTRKLFAHREGFHVGLAVGGALFAGFGQWSSLGGGGRASFVANVGVGPAFDFRTGVDAFLGQWEDGVATFIGVPLKAHFNIGTVYTMMVGGLVGFQSAAKVLQDCSWDSTTFTTTCENNKRRGASVFWGPTLSVLTFRFGDKRQFELAADQSFLFAILPRDRYDYGGTYDDTELEVLFRNDFVFTWLAL